MRQGVFQTGASRLLLPDRLHHIAKLDVFGRGAGCHPLLSERADSTSKTRNIFLLLQVTVEDLTAATLAVLQLLHHHVR